MAKEKLGKAAVGVDPFPEGDETQAAETFGPEVEWYLERRKASMRPRAFVEVERHLRVNAKPLHRAKLSEINRRTLAALLAEIETAKGPVTRNRVRSSLSAFFNFLIREGLLNVSPVAGTGTADEVRSRERVLTDAELAEVWRGLRDDRFGNIVRLLILTGQRRDEIGSLRLSEVDLERELIVLPPDRTKNKRQHEVPLSKQAKAILERAINGAKSSSVIKGSSATALGVNDTKVFGGFLGYHDRKGWLDQQIKLKEPWRLHDLRRTAATGMADKLGVLPHIVEAILNHVSGHRAGVAGIYNRAKYENEMRDALQRWSDYIEGLTAKPLSSQPQQGQGLAY